MSEGAVTAEILAPVPARPETPALAGQVRFEERMAAPFILKSLSAETRDAYRRGIREFFRHAGWPHPTQVTKEHVLRYRDRLWDPLESTCRHASLSIL